MDSRAYRLIPILLLAALVLPGSALAGRYDVVACGDAPGGAAGSWSLTNNDPAPPETGTVHAGDGCGASGTDAGLYVRERLGPGPNPDARSFAFWSFEAPPATTVVALSYRRFLEKVLDADSWEVGLRDAAGTLLESCEIHMGQDRCAVGAPGGERTTLALSTARLEFGAWCVPWGGAEGCDNGSEMQTAHAVMYAATVTLEESRPPTVTAGTAGLFGGGWVAGRQAVPGTASDATGVRRLRLLREGAGAVAVQEKACNPALKLPCDAPGATSAWTGTVDTALLPDGTHELRLQAYDAAENVATSAARLARVDNTAPGPPGQLRVEGQATTTAPVRLRWLQPPTLGGSPNATEVVEVCPLPAGACTTRSTGVDEAESVGLTTPGEYRARVWAYDAVGHGSAARAASLTFRVAEPSTPVSDASPAPSEPDAGAPAEVPPGDPVAPPTVATRRAPALTILSARRRGRRLVLRGDVDRAAEGARVVVRVGATRLSARVRGGRWSRTILLRRGSRPTRVFAQIAGSSTLLPGRAIARIRT